MPLVLKQDFPRYWGMIEGVVGWDMTGFCFTPLGGSGDCRIKNSIEAFNTPDSQIIFGIITEPQGRRYLHLWALDGRKTIIDKNCPPEKDICKNRRIFASIDPFTFDVISQNPLTREETLTIPWGQKYLNGLSEIHPMLSK